MGVFGDVRAFFNATGSVFMILALAAADHLWGDHVFNCPCGDQVFRILYTLAFFFVPPFLIIVIDISWRALCVSLGQNCCCCECGNECKWSCCCCCTCKCSETRRDCNCRTIETVLRLIARPIIIAIVWIIFSCMEPKFGTCFYETSTCDSEGDSQASRVRFGMACFMFFFTILLSVGALVIICRCCRTCHPLMELEDSLPQKALTRSLYAMGLVLNTVLRLRHEGLMNERLLLHLHADAINRLGSSITTGQLEILRVHRTDIRLVRWLLDNGFSESEVRRTLVEAENVTNIEAVRNSLNETNKVVEDAANKLRDELRLVLWLLDNKYSESDVRRILVEAENSPHIEAVKNSLNETNKVADVAANNLRDELRERGIVPGPKEWKTLTRSLYAMGLVPKTVLRLRHEGLMDERLLLHLSDHAINSLGSSITIGQLEILRVHRRDIPLVKWLLEKMDYTEDGVRKILANTLSLKETIEPVRESLNNENTPTNEAVEHLVRVLHDRFSINPRGKSEGTGNQSKPERTGNQSKPERTGNQSKPGEPVLQSLEIEEEA